MRIGAMRAIDRFAGVPLCWLAGLWLRFARKEQAAQPVRNILVIKFFGMGSVLLSSAALAMIKSAIPSARITYLSFGRNRELLEQLPLIDEAITIETSSLNVFLGSSIKLIRHLRSCHFDVVIDFEFFSKFSSLLSALSGAPRRAGFALPTKWRRMILTHEVTLLKARHVKEAFCELAGKALDIPVESPGIPLPTIPPTASEWIRTLVPDDLPIVVINPNAGDTFAERRWPAERFAELINALGENNRCAFAIVGLENEKYIAQAIIERIGDNIKWIDLSGRLSFSELSALLIRADVVVSNDSGPAHLAAILGVRVVTLFGPESPEFYGPLGSNVSTIYKKISCSPCMNVYAAKSFKCPFNARCMREIAVAEVEQVVQELVRA